METYIKLKWYRYPRLQVITVCDNYISMKYYQDCLSVHVGYTSEWHEYIKSTCFQVKPRIGNILKIPSRIANAKRLVKPEEKPVVSDKKLEKV